MSFDKAKDAAAKATEKAGEVASKGVEAAADAANRVTGGRFEDRINTAADKVEGVLGKDKPEEK